MVLTLFTLLHPSSQSILEHLKNSNRTFLSITPHCHCTLLLSTQQTTQVLALCLPILDHFISSLFTINYISLSPTSPHFTPPHKYPSLCPLVRITLWSPHKTMKPIQPLYECSSIICNSLGDYGDECQTQKYKYGVILFL